MVILAEGSYPPRSMIVVGCANACEAPRGVVGVAVAISMARGERTLVLNKVDALRERFGVRAFGGELNRGAYDAELKRLCDVRCRSGVVGKAADWAVARFEAESRRSESTKGSRELDDVT